MMKSSWDYRLLVILLGYSVAAVLSVHRADFTQKVNQPELDQAYQVSQYQNPDSTAWIDDPPLYTLAGLRYVSGDDPTTINFEHQPLTKYLFGLTTVIFGNPLPLQLFLYAALIGLTYGLGRQILKSDRQALLPAVLVSFDPLIREHAHTAYLDLTVAVLILLFLVSYKRLNPWVLGSLIGLIALSKSFMIGGLVFVSYGLYLIINHKSLRQLSKIIASALSVYFLGYTAFFLHGHNLLDFINLHIKILRLYKSYVPEYPKGEVMRIIMTGYWRTWWGDKGLIVVPQWWLFWPVAALGSLINLVKTTKGKLKNLTLPMIFLLVYLLSINLKLVFPRYIIPTLPIMYIYVSALIFGFNKASKVK